MGNDSHPRFLSTIRNILWDIPDRISWNRTPGFPGAHLSAAPLTLFPTARRANLVYRSKSAIM